MQSMKNYSNDSSFCRNDRNTWLIVAAILSGCGLASNAGAQLAITDSTSAPSGNILTSQLTDLGPGTQQNGLDYMNNGGTVGQTFSVAANSTLQSITIQGRGDSAQFYSGGPQPFTAGTTWSIQIASVNIGTGALTPLDVEQSTTYVPTGGGANDASYLTYTLGTPINLTAGQEYAFNLFVNDGTVGQSWFGLAHSTGDAYAGGTAENSNTGASSGTGPVNAYGGFAQTNPNGYDYVFAAQGVVVVPEPTTLALVGLGGLGLIAAIRRRRA
jgi:PEP-CTERM motif